MSAGFKSTVRDNVLRADGLMRICYKHAGKSRKRAKSLPQYLQQIEEFYVAITFHEDSGIRRQPEDRLRKNWLLLYRSRPEQEGVIVPCELSRLTNRIFGGFCPMPTTPCQILVYHAARLISAHRKHAPCLKVA